MKRIAIAMDALGNQKIWLVCSTVIALMMGIGFVAIPALLAPPMQMFLTGSRSDQLFALREAAEILGIIVVVQSILSATQQYLISITGEMVTLRLRSRLLRTLLTLPMSRLAAFQIGDVASRWSGDIGLVQSFATTKVIGLIRYSGQFLVALAFMMTLEWRGTLIALCASACTLVLVNLAMRYLSSQTVRLQELRAGALSLVAEALRNALFIKIAVKQEAVSAKVDVELRSAYRKAREIAVAQGIVGQAINVVGMAVFGALLWYEAQRVISGELAVTAITTYCFAIILMGTAATQIAMLLSSLRQGLAGLTRVATILAIPPEASGGAAGLDLGDGSIEVVEVSVRYPGAARDALDEISLSIPCGSFVVLLGPSGGGKSSLLNTLCRAVSPTCGHIAVGGRPIESYDLDAYRRNIGYMPDDPYLFNGTLRENLRFFTPGASDESLIGVLERASAGDLLDRLAGGLDGEIGPGGARLSRGERQRVAIARLLLADPAIAILDEPTASLDAMNENAVRNALSTLRKGRTMILATHQTLLARDADVVAVIANGRIVESGTFDALRQSGGVLAAMETLQRAGAMPVGV